jgi:hypothetical protein
MVGCIWYTGMKSRRSTEWMKMFRISAPDALEFEWGIRVVVLFVFAVAEAIQHSSLRHGSFELYAEHESVS